MSTVKRYIRQLRFKVIVSFPILFYPVYCRIPRNLSNPNVGNFDQFLRYYLQSPRSREGPRKSGKSAKFQLSDVSRSPGESEKSLISLNGDQKGLKISKDQRELPPYTRNRRIRRENGELFSGRREALIYSRCLNNIAQEQWRPAAEAETRKIRGKGSGRKV